MRACRTYVFPNKHWDSEVEVGQVDSTCRLQMIFVFYFNIFFGVIAVYPSGKFRPYLLLLGARSAAACIVWWWPNSFRFQATIRLHLAALVGTVLSNL